MAKYRIISFDGGGILGLLPIIAVQRLMEEVSGWIGLADLYTGTSTGGLIALGLAKGLSPTELRRLYEDKGSAIFDDSWLDDLKDIGKIGGADYDNVNLTREVKRVLGTETKLKSLKKNVLIPTFDLDNDDPDPTKRSWKPKFFHNFKGGDSDGDELAYKVALYTSAAPTYFPSVDGYVDGGVIANNPSMAALAQTQDRRAFPSPPALDEIVMISFGCGRSLMRIQGKRLDWGYAQWAKPLITLLLSGSVDTAVYQCKQILRDNFHRLNPTMPPDKTFDLDDVQKIPDIVDFAQNVDLSEAVKFLKTKWM
jgi:predicted acylesterase/phospholipase RssA